MTAESVGATSVRLGDFDLGKKLGQGGMGAVYLAHQISLDRPCAVKLLSKEMAARPGFVERFIREARAMARINHPNVVACYAVGEVNGQHYVAMELVDGKSMQVWLKQLGTIPVGDALLVAITVGRALQFAHEKQMIHRDVKPDNILLTNSGTVKLSDMGLAKALDDTDLALTQSGMGLGTPHYMPPEQARDAKHVDHRCDVYALGSTLYHFLTGRVPFHGESMLELISNKEHGKFTPAKQLNKAVPDRLSLIIDRAMAKDPRSRYQSCAEFVADLASLKLTHESLDFINGGGKTVLQPGASPATVLGTSTVGHQQSSAQSASDSQFPRTKTMPGVKQGASPGGSTSPRRSSSTANLSTGLSGTSVAVPTGEWFIKYTDADGKLKVEKLSTARVLKGIHSDQFDLKAKASQSSRGPFLPLAQFPVFADEVDKMLVRYKAKHRHESVAAQYDKLARQYERLKWWHLLKRVKENALGFVGLLVWLAVIGAVGFGLYLGIPIVYDKIAEHVGLRDSEAENTSEPEAQNGTTVPQRSPR